jgi:queuine/archaeosine tRNA-ribosyltransferase
MRLIRNAIKEGQFTKFASNFYQEQAQGDIPLL